VEELEFGSLKFEVQTLWLVTRILQFIAARECDASYIMQRISAGHRPMSSHTLHHVRAPHLASAHILQPTTSNGVFPRCGIRGTVVNPRHFEDDGNLQRKGVGAVG
jgi:hypothetical protein